MTTEAGSETEVKEKAEESAAQPDQSEKAAEETKEVANAEGEEKEKEKEKEGKEGKGISRYLPTWLKKQKSQTSPTKEAPPTEEPVAKVTQGEEGPVPEVNGHAEEVDEKEDVKSEQVKEKEAESHSNASADTEASEKPLVPVGYSSDCLETGDRLEKSEIMSGLLKLKLILSLCVGCEETQTQTC
ncbi:band 4.1-like protein 2 [Stegastes partitus]|uniref:Band 4.1-like protein 2 n=1 Tax=Stegastes partitus TaxID=144197 RepID=A0A9Y4NRA5_9TELE|nr:PREDICTED: band 4.1-like protein 2 [Stegastes partitus]